MRPISNLNLEKTALAIRKSIIKMLVPNKSHHIGCSLSIVEILIVLYFQILNIDPKNPAVENRDIFILSKGHAAAALYATLANRGFFSEKLLKKYDTDGGLLPEHVTRVVPGVEVSTGSLGHGLPIGVGMALALIRKSEARNPKHETSSNEKNSKVSNFDIRISDLPKVYVLMSDGELNEGSNWEAFMFAGFHKLSNLTVIIDANGMQGYGSTQKVLDLGNLGQKISPFGWNTFEVDGHDMTKLTTLLKKLKENQAEKPNLVIAHTIKGKGVKEFEGKFESHYYSISEKMKKEILKDL